MDRKVNTRAVRLACAGVLLGWLCGAVAAGAALAVLLASVCWEE